jgi:hypothetical protein
VLGYLHAAQQGHAVADAARVGAFGEAQRVLRQAGIAQLARRDAEPLAAFAQCLRHGGERNGEALLAAIGLGDGHFQIAAAGVGIRSSMANGPGATVVSYSTAPFWRMVTRIALCHATHHRRIATQ